MRQFSGEKESCYKGVRILNKTMFIVVNVITGLFVTISSVLGYGFSGIGEGSTNDFTILIWLFIWIIGLFLQFRLKARVIGLIITLIPVAYFLYVYIAAVMM
jgi:hypothetical protein